MRNLFMAALAAVTVLALPAVGRAEPLKYDIDYKHSRIAFDWDHWGLSRQVAGFEAFEGSVFIDWDKPELSHVEAEVQATSLHTGLAELDEVLKGPSWLDTAQNPTLTFKSTAVRKTGVNEGEVDGLLTFHGVTRPVTWRLRLVYRGEHPLAPVVEGFRGRESVGLEITGLVRRSEFGLTRSRPLIGDDLQLRITLELSRRPPAAA